MLTPYPTRWTGFHCLRGCLGHRVDLDGYAEEEITLPHRGVRTPNHPARRNLYIDHAITKKVTGRTSSRDASITDTHQIAQYDLCHSLAMLQRDFLQFLIFQQRWYVVPNITDGTAWPAKRCKGRHHYASLLAETYHFGLVQVWVTLDLKQHDLMFKLRLMTLKPPRAIR